MLGKSLSGRGGGHCFFKINPFSAKPIIGRKKSFLLGNFIATLVFMLEREIWSHFYLAN